MNSEDRHGLWLEKYEGQTTDQLIALESRYRIDSLVLAFEEAVDQKFFRSGAGALSDEERVICAVEALEREVNNGGYAQFFQNSSREYAPQIVSALRRIGCQNAADITARSIAALGTSDLTPEAIQTVMRLADADRQRKLDECDQEYFSSTESIEQRLFAFIKDNRNKIDLR